MSEINEEEEAWFLQRLTGVRLEKGPKMYPSGKIVTHPVHGQGRTNDYDPHPGGKVPVYFEGGLKILCNPQTITVIGFVD